MVGVNMAVFGCPYCTKTTLATLILEASPVLDSENITSMRACDDPGVHLAPERPRCRKGVRASSSTLPNLLCVTFTSC